MRSISPLPLLSSISLLLTTSLADLTCTPYAPRGFPQGLYKSYLNFQADNPTAPGVPSSLPAEASLHPTLLLDNYNAHTTSSRFLLSTCSSTTLSFSPSSSNSSCPDFDSICTRSYTDFVRLKNPYTGHCLAAKTPSFASGSNGGKSVLVFESCNDDPLSVAEAQVQLWQVEQNVTYLYQFETVQRYRTTWVRSVWGQEEDGEPRGSWSVEGNGVTVLAVNESRLAVGGGVSAYFVDLYN